MTSNSYRKHYLIISSVIAFSTALWADQSGTVTLAPNTFLNLDSGSVSSSGGDILWSGIALLPSGRVGLYNLGKYGSRAFRAITLRRASSAPYSAEPISAGTLVAGDVFGVRTNGGNYAKVMVTAASGGSISLQYTTFVATHPAISTAAAGGDPPVISQVLNNYSLVLPGQPNYGIAPGSIFIIKGTGLSAATQPVLQSSAASGLPTSLNQTSISVTVNGTTTAAAFYYTSATQLAAVLPSTTPVGTGTVTATYNGASSSAPIQVVASAVGLDTLYGTGNGLAVVTDTSYNVLGLTNSAMPAQEVVFWGAGIGADTNNNDRAFPQNTDNLTNIPTQFFIGGISANVLYRGRSQYPGLDQYNVVIPAGVTPGCFVSVVAQTGSVVSNAVTIAVSATGGMCSDSMTGLSGAKIQTLANKPGGAVNVLAAVLTAAGQGSSIALAAGLPSSFFGQGYEYVSQGSCTVVPPDQGSFDSFLAGLAALDAGTIQQSGPNGQLSLGSGPGTYSVKTTGQPDGAYTLIGSGGKDIGNFQVSLNIPAETLNWTNQAALAFVTRAQGATVTWTGGFPNGFVQIEGSGGAPAVKFFCYAPTSAGQFTIPSSILLAVPPGPGKIYVSDLLAMQPISASGIDLGLLTGGNNTAANLSSVATTFK